jgi:hypothetical protein
LKDSCIIEFHLTAPFSSELCWATRRVRDQAHAKNGDNVFDMDDVAYSLLGLYAVSTEGHGTWVRALPKIQICEHPLGIKRGIKRARVELYSASKTIGLFKADK